MHIDLIESFDAFSTLRPTWDSLYQSDPDSHFFLSVPFLSQIFAHHKNWCLLAARPSPSSDYVAFLSLRLTSRFSKTRRAFINELDPAGLFSWADYTGLLCHPDHEQDAIPALAAHLKKMHWARLNLRHLRISDQRLQLLLPAFDNPAFITKTRPRPASEDATDNELCPRVELPDDFETYLKEKLSASTRQKIRRLLRRLDTSADLRITHSTPQTLDRDLDILIGFWKRKWASRKGAKLERLALRYRDILHLHRDCLVMPILWRNDVPLGALGLFIDPLKKSLLYFIGARDESCDDPPPGLLLHAHSIQFAIGSGLRTYDFLRGNEPFKYSFGAADHRIHNITIRTRTGLNLGRTLEPRCIDDVLSQIAEFESAGHLNDAATGYRQVLDTCPDHPAALLGYATLLYRMQRCEECELFCLRLLDGDANSASAWRLLGKARLALEEFAPAESALRSANALEPTITAHHHLARALQAQGKHAEAARELLAILSLPPRGPRERRHQQLAREQLSTESPKSAQPIHTAQQPPSVTSS